jgi:hypothetical protein
MYFLPKIKEKLFVESQAIFFYIKKCFLLNNFFNNKQTYKKLKNNFQITTE